MKKQKREANENAVTLWEGQLEGEDKKGWAGLVSCQGRANEPGSNNVNKKTMQVVMTFRLEDYLT